MPENGNDEAQKSDWKKNEKGDETERWTLCPGPYF